MIRLFGILLYPVVFLILYAVFEVALPTRNAAMIAALFGAFPVCLLYVRLRTRARARTLARKSEREKTQERIARLMLLPCEAFESLFPGCLCDQSAGGVTEEKLLSFLRANGVSEEVKVASLHGVTPGAEALAALMRIRLECASESEILARTQEADPPGLPPVGVKRRWKKIGAFLRTAQARRFCLRYGCLLMFLSVLSPYRVYYLLTGAFLLGVSLLVRFRLNRRNQIPRLLSE